MNGKSGRRIIAAAFALFFAGALARAQSNYATPYTFTTLTGFPTFHGSTNGTGNGAEFYNPEGVAVDTLGNIYVADTYNSEIRKVTSAGVVTTASGAAEPFGPGSNDGFIGSAEFHFPSGVAVDSAGDVYVADTYNHTIREIDFSTAMVSTVAGLAGSQGSANGVGSAARFNYPQGVAVDSSGNLYVADEDNDTIRKITPSVTGSGTTWTVTTLAGSPGVSGPTNGTGSAALFNAPSGVAVDSAGDVYVADSRNCLIRKITSGGVVTTLAGSAGNSGSTDGTGTAAEFAFPQGVAVDGAGNVYVADESAVRIVTSSGVVTTAAGVVGTSGDSNGAGNGARFDAPQGIAVDSAGNIYVADTANETVRWGALSAPAMTSPTVAAGTSGQAFTYTTVFSGVLGSYTATGMPAGLSLNALTGVISGTLSAAPGTYPVSLGATNGAGASSGTLTLTVVAGVPGAPFNASAVSGNGQATVTFNSPTLTGGVALTEFTVTATPSSGPTVTATGTTAPITVTGLTNGVAYTLAITASNSVGTSPTASGLIEVVPTVPYTFTTLAGSARTGGSDDGTGTAAQFNYPEGVAVDAAGNVYVTDAGNDTIRKITGAGVVTTLAGSAGVSGSADGTGATAQFNNPTAIAVDSSGNLYVADTGNNTIRKVMSTGAVTTLAGLAGTAGSTDGTGTAAEFNYPAGIAVDGAGNVYVADKENNTIRKLTPGAAGGVTIWAVTTIAGSAGDFGTLDGTGNAARFSSPGGVAADTAGNIYVADTGACTIRKVTTAGVVTTLAGSPNNAGVADGIGSAAQFYYPYDLTVDSAGNLYVADSYNNEIRKVTGSGLVSTLAGSPSSFEFSGPYGIGVDRAGNLYVASSNAFTIQWGALAPPVMTSASAASGTDGQSFAYAAAFSGALDDFAASGLPAGLSINPATGVISGTPSATPGSFTVTLGATNGAGSGSGTLTLTLSSAAVTPEGTAPVISERIVTQTVTAGANVSFTVGATGTAPLTFVWTRNGTQITAGVVSGGGSSTLTLDAVTASNSGTYNVAVGNSLGTASCSASLTVNPTVVAPVIVNSTTIAGTLNSPFAFTIVAANNPTSFSATGLPAGLSINAATGAITGTPTAAGTFTVTVGATSAAGTGTATIVLNIQQALVPVVTSSPSASGRSNVLFAGYTITATNSPTSFSAANLPPGLTLNVSTGVISGTPAATNEFVGYDVAITASNAAGTSAAFPLSLTILPAADEPVVSSNPTAIGAVNVAFAPYTITASNTPTSFSANGLPAGLTVNTSTGVISGTPTASGTFSVVLGAANASGPGQTLGVTFIIAPAATAPVISSNLSAGAVLNQPFSYTIAASNSPASFNTSLLPAGITFSGAVISGTPTAAGTFDITLSATNASGTGTATLVITALQGVSVPVISSSSQASGQVGSSFSYTLLANNSPTAFSSVGLPIGLTLSATTGIISGTPAAAGTYAAQLTASNAGGTGQTFILTITISPAEQTPSITSAATASATAGVPFSYVITTNVAAISYAASNLPPGLALNSVTGVMFGTPGAAGQTYAVSLTATNAAGMGSPLILIIAIHASAAAPTITSSLTATGTQGAPFSYTVTATNMPSLPLPVGDGYSAQNGLPPGLGINPATGVISGIPTAVGTTSVVLAATNDTGASQWVTVAFTINPAQNAPSITSGNTAAAAIGAGFTYQITASPAAASYGVSGNPAWLGINTAVGLLAGTPNGAPGTYTVSLTAKNSSGTSAPLMLTITVGAAAGTPVVTSSASPAAGAAQSTYPDTAAGALYQIAVQPSAQIQYYFVSGSLPAGLNLDPALGLIYGTPTVPGTATIAVGAANEIGIGSSSLVTLTIDAAPGTPQITNSGGSSASELSRGEISEDSGPSANGTVGAAFSYQITATGNPTLYSASNLPVGLAVNPSTGLITGVPTTAGTTASLVSASNGTGVGASTTLIVTIDPPASAPSITSAPTAPTTAGTAFSYQIAASNTPTSFNASGLATGLALNSTNGLISGTPTVPGVYSVSLSANNASGTGPGDTLTLTVASAAGAPAITSASTAIGTVASAFNSYQVAASNGPITSYTGVNLPPGLSVDPIGGAITGTPSVAGDYTATLTANNAIGPSSPFALSITVAPATTSSSVTSATTAGATSGSPFSYQIAATNSPASYNVTGLPSGLSINTTTGVISGTASVAGTYPVQISVNNATGTGATFILSISVINPSSYAYLSNLSARANVNTGADILIAGFTIGGSGSKQLLLRVDGPALSPGISNYLAEPQLALYDSGNGLGENGARIVASDAGWGNNPVPGTSTLTTAINPTSADLMNTLGASPVWAADSFDSALTATLPVSSFTYLVSGQGPAPTGVAVAEIYDADTGIPAARLTNISARAQVGTGSNILIAGFVIVGNTTETVLIRGVGTGLLNVDSTLTGLLAAPTIALYDSHGQQIATNTGWGNASTLGNSPVVAIVEPATSVLMNEVGAFPLDASDCAMVVTLPAGAYTMLLSGVNGTTGIGLVEVYEVP